MIIADNEHIQIHYKSRSTDIIVITFSHMGFSQKVEAYWGAGALENCGLSALGVVCKGNLWFPPRSMADAMQQIGTPPWATYKNRITYGSSMGAYAAIKFGRLVGATTALAMAPQFSIDPAVCGQHDRLHSSFFNAQLHAGSTIEDRDISCQSFVFHDPAVDIDRFHAHALHRLSPRIKLVPMFSHGHEPVDAFAGRRTMLSLISACIGGDENQIRAVASDARRRSGRRIYGLATAMLPTRPVQAAALFDAYRERVPNHLQKKWQTSIAACEHKGSE